MDCPGRVSLMIDYRFHGYFCPGKDYRAKISLKRLIKTQRLLAELCQD